MRYWKNDDDGSLRSRMNDEAEAPDGDGWSEITEGEYGGLLAQLNNANADALAAAVAQEQSEAHTAYDALVAVNIPAPVAARLTGWSG